MDDDGNYTSNSDNDDKATTSCKQHQQWTIGNINNISNGAKMTEQKRHIRQDGIKEEPQQQQATTNNKHNSIHHGRKHIHQATVTNGTATVMTTPVTNRITTIAKLETEQQQKP
jgi:hypothetical protein